MRSRLRNAGFTIIEYVVAFAILSIAVLGIWGFYLAASNQSISVNKRSDLYNEAQLTVNQMERILVNTDLGVQYDETGKILTVYNIAYDDYGNAAGIEAVSMKWEDNKIYYNESSLVSVDEGAKVQGMTASGEWQLMSEGVSSFDITLEEHRNRLVTDLHFEKGRYDYKLDDNPVAFRNDVVFVDEDTTVKHLLDNIDVVLEDAVTGVTISINPGMAGVGSDVRLNWTVTGVGTVPQTINKWVIATDESMDEAYVLEDSSVEGDGDVVLDFGGSGIPKAVYFQAFVNDVDRHGEVRSVVASNIVQLRLVQDMTLAIDGVEGTSYVGGPYAEYQAAVGEKYQMIATVTGDEISSLEKTISWTIEDIYGSADAEISADGVVSIDRYSSSGAFYAVASLKSNPSINVKYRFNVTSTYSPSDQLVLTNPTGKTSINRGGETKYEVTLNGRTVDPADCDWTVTLTNNGTGQQSITGSPVTVGTTGVLTVKDNLSYDNGYTATVTAKLKKAPAVTGSASIQIPRVEIKFDNVEELIYRSESKKVLSCTVTGLEEYDIKWTMARNTNSSYFFGADGNTNITGVVEDGVEWAFINLAETETYNMGSIVVKASLVGNSSVHMTQMIKTPAYLEFALTDSNGNELQSGASVSRTGWILKTATINVACKDIHGNNIWEEVNKTVSFSRNETLNYEVVGNSILVHRAGTLTIHVEYHGQVRDYTITVK